jgi:hypothetical protein
MTTDTLPAITGAEFRAMREYLGLSLAWMARHVMCDQRRLLRMEMDQEDIPSKFASQIDDLYEETAEITRQLTAKYKLMVDGRSAGDTILPVYRSDDEYRADRKRKIDHGARFTAQWHRMVAQRVADVVPGVVLAYREPAVRKPKPWEKDRDGSVHAGSQAGARHAG